MAEVVPPRNELDATDRRDFEELGYVFSPGVLSENTVER